MAEAVPPAKEVANVADDRTTLILEDLLEQVRAMTARQGDIQAKQAADNVALTQLLEYARRQRETENATAREAAEYRQGVRTEIGGLSKEITALRMEQANYHGIVTDVKTALKVMQEKIQVYEDMRVEARGGAKVVIYVTRALYLVGGAFLATVGAWVQHYLNLPKPPVP